MGDGRVLHLGVRFSFPCKGGTVLHHECRVGKASSIALLLLTCQVEAGLPADLSLP